MSQIFMVFFKFELKNRMKNFTKFEVTLRSCKSCVQMRLLNCFQFPRCDVFLVHFKFFEELIQNFTKFYGSSKFI